MWDILTQKKQISGADEGAARGESAPKSDLTADAASLGTDQNPIESAQRKAFEEAQVSKAVDRKVRIFMTAFAVASIIVITVLSIHFRRIPEPPPVLYTLPEWKMQDQNGETIGSKALEGQVYIADFVFTTCQTFCPALTSNMKSLQDRFLDEEKVTGQKIPIRLVSFTVDPEHDVPDVLKGYATEHGADLGRWSFVTGTLTQVTDLLEKGFKLPVGDKLVAPENRYDLSHSRKFVLVDRKGGIRGYYATDKEGLDEIYQRSLHVYLLEKEP